MINWLKRRLEKRAVFEQGNGYKWLSNIMELFAGPKSSSGVSINPSSAITIPAVYTAVRLIAGTVATLPLHVFRRTDTGGREIAMRHWSYPLLHDSPNEYHTSLTWRELLVAHILLWGNSYNRIEWMGNGTASALYPLMPWDVQVKLTNGGSKYYHVRLPDGGEDLPDDEVVHVPGISYDGLTGMSVIEKMRDALGLAKSAENFGGSFFANGAKIGQVLEIPSRMNEAAQKKLAESLTERFGTPDGAFKTLVLEDGAKMHGPLTMPLKDAQFLEIRKYQRAEIFGWYGVPPHLGGDTERSTSWGTGIEQQDIGYAKHTITPLCVRIEQELNRKLFTRGAGMYCKHSLDALMRGDFKSRMEGLQIAVGRPWLSVNEARELEDWNTRGAEYNDIALPLNIGMGAPKPAATDPTLDPVTDPVGSTTITED